MTGTQKALRIQSSENHNWVLDEVPWALMRLAQWKSSVRVWKGLLKVIECGDRQLHDDIDVYPNL